MKKTKILAIALLLMIYSTLSAQTKTNKSLLTKRNINWTEKILEQMAKESTFFAVAMMAVISAYYLYAFYRFYKHMHQYAAATKDGLLELYFELRLNMERYKSFGFLLIPFGIIWIGLYKYNNLLIRNITLESLSNNVIIIVITSVVIFTAAMIIAINTWVNSFYREYTKQTPNILDELKEE